MSANPTPDEQRVDDLIEEIRQAARLRRAKPDAASPFSSRDGDNDPGVLDFHLADLARLSQPRSELPHRFRRFPLNFAPVRKAALALYNLLTRQQRASNVTVRDALQAMQRALARNDSTLRDTAVLSDYVRALLIQRVSVSSIQATTGAETKDDLDTFYVALEDEFRGSPELIKDRLSVYLPLISSANLKGPAVDLGCGRGEWLELMRDAAVGAIGVEQNSLLVAASRGKGLQVLESDFQTFLEQSPAQHWQLVTGFHVIEHLGWPGWYGALGHMYRALQPGGMLILETPDPANIYTSANRFFLDPTHRHPLPDILLEFAARSVGFASVEILKLHPEPGIDQHGVGHEAFQLLGRLTGAQDYALIARK